VPDGFHQLLVAGLLVNIVDINIPDRAGFIDNKYGSLGFSLRAQNTVLLCDTAMRPEIAQQWIIDAPQAFGPGLQAGNMVNAYTQNLGI
jgi:hypothetical protein